MLIIENFNNNSRKASDHPGLTPISDVVGKTNLIFVEILTKFAAKWLHAKMVITKKFFPHLSEF